MYLNMYIIILNRVTNHLLYYLLICMAFCKLDPSYPVMQNIDTHAFCFSSRVRFERDKRNLLDQYDSDGALSAPELPMSKRKDRGEFC